MTNIINTLVDASLDVVFYLNDLTGIDGDPAFWGLAVGTVGVLMFIITNLSKES